MDPRGVRDQSDEDSYDTNKIQMAHVEPETWKSDFVPEDDSSTRRAFL